VAKEKLQTKRGTVLVRIHGTKPHCKSSGDNTSGQPRFAPKVPFMNKNNFENVEKTLNIIHVHRIFHYKPSSYCGIPIYGNPHIEPSGYAIQLGRPSQIRYARCETRLGSWCSLHWRARSVARGKVSLRFSGP